MIKTSLATTNARPAIIYIIIIAVIVIIIIIIMIIIIIVIYHYYYYCHYYYHHYHISMLFLLSLLSSSLSPLILPLSTPLPLSFTGFSSASRSLSNVLCVMGDVDGKPIKSHHSSHRNDYSRIWPQKLHFE